ncbi:hypothetical protein, partial [Streptomyces sp. NPDC002533]
TGKTAVGLHRVAYLLYAHRERLARTGTLVIGPARETPAPECRPNLLYDALTDQPTGISGRSSPVASAR